MSEATPKTKGHGEARRELILDTTLRLIASGGVDSVTHRRVAEDAGIPLGSTTYYFDSKEHLLREAFEHYLASATRLQSDVIWVAVCGRTLRSEEGRSRTTGTAERIAGIELAAEINGSVTVETGHRRYPGYQSPKCILQVAI